MRIRTSALDVTSIVVRCVVGVNRTNKKPGARWGGRAWERLRRRGGLDSPHVVTGCAVVSDQPCGWRLQQQIGRHTGVGRMWTCNLERVPAGVNRMCGESESVR